MLPTCHPLCLSRGISAAKYLLTESFRRHIYTIYESCFCHRRVNGPGTATVFFSCHQHLTHVSKMHSGGGDRIYECFLTIVDVVTLWGEIVINFSQNWKLTRSRIPIIYHYISLYYIPIISPEYHHRFAAESHIPFGFFRIPRFVFSPRCSIFSARAIAFCQKVIPSFLDNSEPWWVRWKKWRGEIRHERIMKYNNVLLVKKEGPVWYTIYHHLPVVKGVNKPLYQSTNQWEKDIYDEVPQGEWTTYWILVFSSQQEDKK